MKLPILIGYILVGVFVLLALLQANYEFVGYSPVLIPFIVLVHLTDKRFNYHSWGLWGLNIWVLSHLLGGLGSIQGIRVYDFILLNLVGPPYQILKYDQLVHFLCYIVMAVLFVSIVFSTVKKSSRFPSWVHYCIGSDWHWRAE